MKKILLALALLLLPSASWAQCTGVFPANTLCGNLTGAARPPGAFSASGTIIGPSSSTISALAVWANTSGTQLGNAISSTVVGPYTWTGAQQFNSAVTISGTLSVSPTATGGSVPRPLVDQLANTVWAKNFGAKCDQLTDDTTALQAAINATPDGGTLMLPAGFCKVLGSGAAALTIAQAINIVGQGSNGSVIFPDASFPSGRDFILVAPVLTSKGYSFRDFAIAPGSLGRHGISVDGQALSLVYNININRVLITASNSGKSVFGTGATSGVFAYSTIQNSNLESILIDSGGDGINIVNNVIGGGANTAIDVTQVPGAAGLYITGNVLASSTNGQINVERGYPFIVGNELEQPQNSTQTHGAMIDLNGSVGQGVSLAQITGNTIGVVPGVTGVTNAIRVGNSQDANIDGNRVSVRGTANHIATTISATGTTIGAGNGYYIDDLVVPLKLVDLGKQTGLITANSFVVLSAPQTGSDSISPQTWFPGGGPTTFTVPMSATYAFDGMLALARTAGTNNHNTSVLFAGTAPVSSIAYTATGIQNVGGAFAAGNAQTMFISTTAQQAILGATASANEHLYIAVNGIVRFAAGGTFTPQFIYSNAPGASPTVQTSTRFNMRLLGPSDVIARGWN